MKIRKFYLLVWAVLLIVCASITFALYPKDRSVLKTATEDAYNYIYIEGQDYQTHFVLENNNKGYRAKFAVYAQTNTNLLEEYAQIKNYAYVVDGTEELIKFFISEIDFLEYNQIYNQNNRDYIKKINQFSDNIEAIVEYANEVYDLVSENPNLYELSWQKMRKNYATALNGLKDVLKDINILYTNCGKQTSQKNELSLEVVSVLSNLITTICDENLCEQSTTADEITNYYTVVETFFADTASILVQYPTSSTMQSKFKIYTQNPTIQNLLEVVA